MKLNINIVMIVLVLFLSGCQSDNTEHIYASEMLDIVSRTVSSDQTSILSQEVDPNQTLNVWIPYDYVTFDDTMFLANNPMMTINYKVFSKETVDSFITGLLSEETPDVLVVKALDYGVFSKLDVFEDYDSQPYEFSKMLNRNDVFSHLGWSMHKDKKIGLMTHFSPLVTYYRKDILESLGYSSKPEDVASYITNIEDLSKLTLDLKGNNHYILQWKDDFNSLVSVNTGYFDIDGNMIRNSSQYKDIYNFSLAAYQESYVSNINFWAQEGTVAIKEDQIVMMYLGSWGTNEISLRAPEQNNKWGVTSLPFNMTAYEGYFMLIPKKSVNKDKAWEWIYQNYMIELANWEYDIQSEKTFLGNQILDDYLEPTLNATKNTLFTPFDYNLEVLYKQQFNDYIQSELSFEEFIEAFEKVSKDSYKDEMLDYINSYNSIE